ncbi:hypothetical protein N5T67_03880 [Aliarcobacter butzleri]|uniref:hypothetical protein n=1 Tax=Aliarcobacter butzleri TaxID=28197 RepID=UPI0021B3DA45|nr:hypothetical protein [Aliarcobacter butzleri]MCT7551973.1 hypothetical protein [Aliarcobacter butzleri]
MAKIVNIENIQRINYELGKFLTEKSILDSKNKNFKKIELTAEIKEIILEYKRRSLKNEILKGFNFNEKTPISKVKELIHNERLMTKWAKFYKVPKKMLFGK